VVQVADSLALIDGSDNPAGCHKTHMIRGLRELLAAESSTSVTAGTCGNYGLALAQAAAEYGCRAVICIPASYSGAQAAAIRATGAVVVFGGETYEDAVAHSTELAHRDGLLDCNPGGPYDDALLEGLAGYLVEELGAMATQLENVWVPMGNGTTALAALRAIRELDWDCRVHAVTSVGNNSILAAWPTGSYTDLQPTDLRETHTNEPLCNWRALHGDKLFEAADGQLSVLGVTDHDLERAAGSLGSGARYTPSGSAGLAGYRRTGTTEGTNAVLLTARHSQPTG